MSTLESILTEEDRRHIKSRWNHLDKEQKATCWKWLENLYDDLHMFTTLPLIEYFNDYKDAYAFFASMKVSMQEDERRGQEEWLTR